MLPHFLGMLAMMSQNPTADPSGQLVEEQLPVCAGNPVFFGAKRRIVLDNEKVRLKVGTKWVTATCAFAYRNLGRTARVKMGFPDTTFGADSSGANTMPGLQRFHVFVDGKRVKGEQIVQEKGAGVFHQFDVLFKRRQTCYIVNEFRLKTDSFQTKSGARIHEFGFQLHQTPGAIKKLTFLAQFDEGLMPRGISTSAARDLHAK